MLRRRSERLGMTLLIFLVFAFACQQQQQQEKKYDSGEEDFKAKWPKGPAMNESGQGERQIESER